MKKYEQKNQLVESLVDVICDCCNKSCDVDPSYPGHSFEYAELTSRWGFYSRKDEETHTSVVCEECYDKMLELMKIKPKITHYLPL